MVLNCDVSVIYLLIVHFIVPHIEKDDNVYVTAEVAGFAGLTELPSPLETQWSVSRLATTSSSKLLIVPATTSTRGGFVCG